MFRRVYGNLNNTDMVNENPPPFGPSSWPDAAGEVYVVEDDAALRRSILRAIRAAKLAARTYERAADFLEDAPHLPGGCLVTDFSMPGMDGLELIRRVRAARMPFSPILITGHADVRLAVEAMKAGAADFIEKPFESELILRLVRACLEENDEAVDANAKVVRVRRRLESLTARERQVLELIIAGSSNKQIAAALAISPRTVEIYRANVMSKMRADSLSDLVRMTLAAGAA